MRTKLHRVLFFLCSFGDLPSTRARVTIPPTDYLTSFLPFYSLSFLNRVPSLSCLPVPSLFQVCSTSTNVPSSLEQKESQLDPDEQEGRNKRWNMEQGTRKEDGTNMRNWQGSSLVPILFHVVVDERGQFYLLH